VTDKVVTQGPAADAALAALLFAIDPVGLGGVVLRGRPGPVRDGFLALLRGCLNEGASVRRMPLNIAEGRLLGGLDIAATLRAGRPVAERGLLAEADGGVVVMAMAERLPASVAAQICAVIDTGSVVTCRDGVAFSAPASIGFVALDEGMGDEEALAPGVLDRFALRIDLSAGIDEDALPYDRDQVVAARARLNGVTSGDAVVEALSGTALALGAWSLRAPLLALRLARAAAALAGRTEVAMEDAALAARLVLAPRATRMPAAEPSEATEGLAEDAPETPPEPQADASSPPDDTPDSDEVSPDFGEMAEIVLEAAAAAIPAGLLAQLRADGALRGPSRSQGKSGALKASGKRGRPAGLRRGGPGPNARLNLVETLRAAAPWQRLRLAEGGVPGRIQVRFEDFHVSRFKQRTETTTIFAVDASGSAASTRLAEAKGAVELLLADCYIRRDTVAVVAFRGKAAEILLPPTRSLVRAKRSLSGLPGGGGTPLAAGLDAAEQLAALVQRRGGTPVIVVLTDGRSNVGRDGLGGRAKAEQEATQAAGVIRLSQRIALLVDTSTRPSPLAQALAASMSARYLPLPYVDAARLSSAVQSVTPKSR
jgi:magnesium chelatase subunit D